jgi:ubiquinone biosynthesis protein UbiJ
MMQRPDRAMRNQLKELRGAVEDLSERLERLEAEE